MASTKDVLDHHIKCFGDGDLKGILSDYAPGAVLFTPDGPLRGAGGISPFFQAMIAEFGKPGTAFSMKQQFVDGDYAYVLWTADTADNMYEFATDTLVVRDGKIVAQSFAGKITPKSSSTHKRETVKRLVAMFAIVAIQVLALSVVTFAQDSNIGTWKLNVAKSR